MEEPMSKRFKNDSSNLTCTHLSKPYRLPENFYDVPCLNLAKSLLGTILVRKCTDGSILKGKIVETECYPGGKDKASYSYNGRRTPKNEPMFMKPGTLFVYQTYGMYFCMNISSKGDGAAVLIRAVEPLSGFDKMSENRSSYHIKRKTTNGHSVGTLSAQKKLFKSHELCNGPSKLCISFDINKENCNKQNLIDFPNMWLEPRVEEVYENDIIISSRIGIESAGSEWANEPLRFYLHSSKSVSVRDKNRETTRNAAVK